MRLPIVLVCGALAVAACGDDDSGGSHADAGAGQIGPAGGTVTVVDGPTLTIPAGALATTVTITITKTTEMIPGAVTPVFTFEPEGLTFAAPVTVSFPLANQTTALSVYWSKAAGAPGYDELASTQSLIDVSASIMHFSTGYVALVTPQAAVGTDHTYVLSSILVPLTNNQARQYGLDLDGDQAVENQLGMVFGTFATMGINWSVTTTEAVDHGTALVLADLVTTSYTTAQSAGLRTYVGATPNPAPCLNGGDNVCRQHLAGTGAFTIATTSPDDPPLVGDFMSGTLTAGPGHSSIQMAFVPSRAFTVHLIGARTKVSGASDTGIVTGVLAGGVSATEIDTVFIPELAIVMGIDVAADCSALTAPPGCGCTSSSPGSTWISLFDVDHNCSVSEAEVRGSSFMMSLLAPDLMLEGQEAISLGFGFTAVPGTFTP